MSSLLGYSLWWSTCLNRSMYCALPVKSNKQPIQNNKKFICLLCADAVANSVIVHPSLSDSKTETDTDHLSPEAT